MAIFVKKQKQTCKTKAVSTTLRSNSITERKLKSSLTTLKFKALEETNPIFNIMTLSSRPLHKKLHG